MPVTPGEDQQATRKERREQARQDRKALEAQHSQAQARQRRLMQLGGAALAAIIVIGVVIAVASSGSSSHISKPGSKAAVTAVNEVTELLAGIPQQGNALGNPKAPVTMQYFGDLECPICREFTLGALPSLITKDVRTGKLRIEYHAMETATREPTVFREQQTAALAAGKQNRLWDYVELFYHQQGQEDTGYVTPAYLRERADQVPDLNLAKWEEERHNPAYEASLEKDAEEVGRRGFTGTPSFLLGKTDGELSPFSTLSLTEPSSFEAAINSVNKK
jgi:protein-disulfide isomerase